MSEGNITKKSFREDYRELMERITLTEKEKEKILGAASAAGEEEKSGKPGAGSFWRRPAARVIPLLAAAAVLALLYTAVLPKKAAENPSGAQDGSSISEPEGLAGSFYSEEMESLSALSEAAGFAVKEVSGLPFEVSDTIYTHYSDGLAEVTSIGTGGEQCIFRMAMGTEDVSGDYTDYREKKQIQMGPYQVTIYGNSTDFYVLARWTDGTYAFSVAFQDENGALGYPASVWESVRVE